MGVWQAGRWAGGVALLLAVAQPAAAESPASSGFGSRKPAILGITTDSAGERVARQLKAHGDLWGARSKTLREETATPGPAGTGGPPYIQRVSLQLTPQSMEERTRFGGNDTIRVEFSTPASGNTAVLISRELTFTGLVTPPSMVQYVEKLFADYGKPTLIADNRILWLYRKGGQLASVGRSYTAQSAMDALKSPRLPPDPPVIDTVLGVDVGKCVRALDGASVARDIARLWQEATCDAALVVLLSGSEDRLRAASFQINDLERRAGNAALDARSREAADKR